MNPDPLETYLKVKLMRPQVRSRRVVRQRLLRRLDEVFAYPVTLVCAPAGYGKTTLLVDWAQSGSTAVAWLTLDAAENDAARFFHYFILAVQQAYPEVGRSAQMTVNIPGEDSLESGLRLLVNDLAGLDAPLAVVLDDYHWIESPAVHTFLSALIDYLPAPLHLVIASRTEPPIPLARLRGRAALLELRAADLSFNPDEIKAFLRQVMALDFSPETCRQLAAQTEGWAAGLQLAALSLQSGEVSISGSPGAGQHYIFDYLAEEVLHRQPPDVQRFLLHTSILAQLTGPLCDALVQPFAPHADGSECLEALEHANLFIQALDGEHCWYRYHALFTGFLRDYLSRVEADGLAQLHQRAARWLSANGGVDEAFEHALAGGDFNLAAELVERHAEMLEVRGELTTLSRWIEALPEEAVRSRPRIHLARAWVAMGSLDVSLARQCLDRADEIGIPPEEPTLRGEILAARAFLAGLMNQEEEAGSLSEQAIHYLPGEKHYLIGLLKFVLCFPQFMSGNLPRAVHMLEEAVSFCTRSNSHFIALLSMRILGEGYLMMGRLTRAQQVFEGALETAVKHFGENSPLEGMARMGLGEVSRQRNDFSAAERNLEEGIEKCALWMPALALDGFMWLAQLKQAAGDFAGAQGVLRQAHHISQSHNHPLLDDWWLPISSVRLDIFQGNLEEALRWARGEGLELDGLSNLDSFCASKPAAFRESALYTLGRLFLVLGRREKIPEALDKAAKVLAYVLPISEERGHNANVLEGLVLLAQVEQARSQPKKAQDDLHRALDLGAPEQQLRVFLDEGEPLMTLFAGRRDMHLPSSEREYIEALWAAWLIECGETPRAGPASPPGWVEPLSFREIEVLRGIAEGKSNQQIAAELVLSLNTIKKHVSTIMDKLGAKNRMQAVLMARQFGLLD